MIKNFDNEAPVIRAIFAFQEKFYLINQKLSKQFKYTLGQKGENLNLEILEMTVLAYRKPKIEQLPILEKIDAKLEVLRLTIRMGWELGFLKNNQMIELQKDLSAIGKMLGGWIKSRRLN